MQLSALQQRIFFEDFEESEEIKLKLCMQFLAPESISHSLKTKLVSSRLIIKLTETNLWANVNIYIT